MFSSQSSKQPISSNTSLAVASCVFQQITHRIAFVFSALKNK
jgi:hypothetical protein